MADFEDKRLRVNYSSSLEGNFEDKRFKVNCSSSLEGKFEDKRFKVNCSSSLEGEFEDKIDLNLDLFFLTPESPSVASLPPALLPEINTFPA